MAIGYIAEPPCRGPRWIGLKFKGLEIEAYDVEHALYIAGRKGRYVGLVLPTDIENGTPRLFRGRRLRRWAKKALRFPHEKSKR